MIEKNFSFKDGEDLEIFVYKWEPEVEVKPMGVVQIAHGMAEHAGRYERFAEKLTAAGYTVYANDHRGHGRTAGDIENVGYCGEDGFKWMLKDMKELTNIIKGENPGLPVFLFGHSMGSMLSQMYIALYGNELKGVILSGTSGKQGFILNLGIFMAKRQIVKIGVKTPSKTMNKMTFASYNNEFTPTRTPFDWLSRDEREVDKYIKDPFCGGVFSSGFFYDFLRGLKEMHRVENMERIPKELPIYFISGEKDPVGKNCRTITGLIEEYRKLGIKDVSYKFYKDGRHEMLNEINRD
ncbi:MAG: lysophospholipase, partial [Clostridiales bacterium]|nr:lysophospholipase [Clostridiales bacterium]